MTPALPLMTLAFVNILQPYDRTAYTRGKTIEELKHNVFSTIETLKLRSCKDALDYCKQYGNNLDNICRITIEGVLCHNFTTDDDFKRLYHKIEELYKRQDEEIEVLNSKNSDF